MKLYFVRHGETDLNRENKLQGRIDCPLNDTGIRQALDLRGQLLEQQVRFDRVMASPLTRAVQTAALIADVETGEVIRDDRLLEISYGIYEGVPFTDLKQEMFAFFRDPEHVEAPDGVEKISEVMERTGDFLSEMSQICSDEKVLVVTHGVALRAVLGHIQGNGDSAVWGIPVENCTLYIVECKDGVWKEL
jgi:alpha-ribazole phosphatase/probable phosphoglycerate mutase